MNINYKNLKLVLTNYRWYIAILWAIFLIPVWFLPMLLVTLLTALFGWLAIGFERITLGMVAFSENYLSWAARWFENSINPDDVDNG